MIKITIPSNHIQERKYIIDVIINDFLGLSYTVEPNKTEEYYRLELPNGNTLIIEDHFFNSASDNYFVPENIPTNVNFIKNEFIMESNLPVIYGKNQTYDCSITLKNKQKQVICSTDIFASSFFMLSRWEEYAIKKRDNHNRFISKESLAVKFNFIDRPIVNEYTEMLWNILLTLGINQERKTNQFKFIPTHDIDHIYLWRNNFSALKTLAGDILKRKSIKHFGYNLKSLLKNEKPYDTFDFIMDISEKNNLSSTFYFMSGGNSEFDNHYEITDPFVVNKMMNITHRGHKIGLHTSYNSYNCKELIDSEINRLNNVANQNITEVRQHYLRFELPTTWQLLNECKFEFDSTTGYADREGFRCGVCYEFPIFNILTREKLNLIERPLIAMEGTFLDYNLRTPVQMETKLKSLIDVTKKYNGCFTLLWHNSSFNVYPWHRYKDIYLRILNNMSNH